MKINFFKDNEKIINYFKNKKFKKRISNKNIIKTSKKTKRIYLSHLNLLKAQSNVLF